MADAPLMAGKKGLVMGIANDRSLAYGIAKAVAGHGAELALTYQGDALAKRVMPIAEKLGAPIVAHADVTDDESLDQLFRHLEETWGRLDFVVHAIAFSDKEELKGKYLDTSAEIADMGAGNVLCAAIASPPGSTDVVASTIYEEFGASSRWMALTTAAVCVVMAMFGSHIMPWMPKLVVGSTVLLFAWQIFYEWMYQNVRGSSRSISPSC